MSTRTLGLRLWALISSARPLALLRGSRMSRMPYNGATLESFDPGHGDLSSFGCADSLGIARAHLEDVDGPIEHI